MKDNIFNRPKKKKKKRNKTKSQVWPENLLLAYELHSKHTDMLAEIMTAIQCFIVVLHLERAENYKLFTRTPNYQMPTFLTLMKIDGNADKL